MITGFYTTVKGVLVFVEITYWEQYVEAQIHGDPLDCYPAEGGVGEYKLWDCTSRNFRMLDLERSMDLEDDERLQREMFNFMERDNEG